MTSTASQSFTIAITGTNRGIGLGMALAAGARGHRVLTHARLAAPAEAVAQRVSAAGGMAAAVSGDIREPELGAKILSTARASFGQVPRVVILSAGILGPAIPLADMAQADFERVLEVNVNAQFSITRALIPAMLAAGGGALIFLTSGLGRFALPGYAAYTVSKHAVEGLAKQVDADHGAQGLRSVCVAPGMVQTDMLRAALGTDDVSAHETVERCGQGFVRLVEELAGPDGQALSGKSLDIDRWLPPVV